MLAGYDHLLRAADRLRWDEADIDLGADAADWPRLSPGRREALRRLIAGFCVAEAAVAEHLEPFCDASADPVLRACFTAQQDDELRHARFFRRVAAEVIGLDPDEGARAVARPALVDLFERELPQMARGIATGDRSLADGVALYHLVLEGVVFAAGQSAALALLDRTDALSATREGVRRVQGDERWHIGLGVRCLQDSGLSGPAVASLAQRAVQAAAAWGLDVVDGDGERRALLLARRRFAIAGAGSSASAPPVATDPGRA